MEITIKELRLMINTLEKTFHQKLETLKEGATNTYIKEINSDNLEQMNEEIDFNEEVLKTEELITKYQYYKYLLSKANNETVIPKYNITIQEAVISVSLKRKYLDTLDKILFKFKPSKNRIDSGSFSGGSAYYEICSLNFDKKALINNYHNLLEEINSLEAKIEEANTNTLIEI